MSKSIKSVNLGVMPILKELCELAKIEERVNNLVEWREENSKISPGLLIVTLIISIIVNRKPLWKLEQFWKKHNVETLFKEYDVSFKQFNDDAYGRALDKLSEIDMQTLISTISLEMLKVHEQNIEVLHLDTTSKSVQGAYENDDDNNDDNKFNINHGYSKDKRPDLKQFKLGAGVNQNKLPIMGELLSGNKSDSDWNPEAIVNMKSFLEKNEHENVIFVGDSATVASYDNLKALKDIKFISRFPSRFSLTKELKKTALDDDRWENIGKISERKKASEYKITSYIRVIKGIHYRFVVVHSSQLEKKKRHTIKRKLAKEKEKLSKKASNLSRNKFACIEDAKDAENKFIKKLEKSKFNYEYESKIIKNTTIIYDKQGRPSKEDKGKKIIEYSVKISITGFDKEALEQLILLKSCFVLITSILDKSNYNQESVLREYKNQSSIERTFRFLKNPVYLGPIYLKKPERIEAMGYVFMLVLLIASYLEYRVRKSLKDNEEYLLDPNGNKNTRPSVKTILEIVNYVPILIIDGKRYFPDNIDSTVFKMIEWAGFNSDIYL